MSTIVKLGSYELRVSITFDEHGSTVEIEGDTYQVNQTLRFKEVGFRWDRYAAQWIGFSRSVLSPALVKAWLEASWAAKAWVSIDKVAVAETTEATEAETTEAVEAPIADTVEAVSADTAEVSEVVSAAKELPVQLMPHQTEAALRIVAAYNSNAQGGFLLADAPRVGKTYAILAALRILGKPVLVLSPASVVGMWRRELQRWGVSGAAMSYETFRSRGHDGDPAIVVLDEAHKVKNVRATVTRKVISFCKTRFVVAATGTPFQNGPAEFQTILGIARLPAAEIMRGGVGMKHNRWGRLESYWISSRLADVRKRLQSCPQYLRRELADVAQYLPKLSRQILEAEGKNWDGVVMKIWEALEDLEHQYRRDGKTSLADKVWDVMNGLITEEHLGALFPVMSTLRKLIGEAKADFVKIVVSDLIGQDEPFLIFAHHTAVRDAIRQSLTEAGVPFGEIAGDTSQAERQRVADAFQRGELRVLMLSTRAAGEGLTLSRAAAAVFAEIDWNPAVLTQAENRLLNVAEGGNKVACYIIAPHPLERRMVELVNRKAKDAEGVYAAEGSIARLEGETRMISTTPDDPTPTPTPDPAPTPDADWWGAGEPTGYYASDELPEPDADTEPTAHHPNPELPLWGTQPELWAGLPQNAGAEYIPPRIVREGVRGQGWKRGTIAPTTLRVKQVTSTLWAVYVGGVEACVGSEAEVVAYMRNVLPSLSLRKPGRDTLEFLLRHRLLEFHPNPNRRRGRKHAYRSVEALPPREERVGFSEIAAVMGQSPFTTPLELWRVKVGLDAPKPETFAMRWGKATERIALRLFCEQTGAKQVKRHVKAADGVLAGEVDAIARINGEWCVVEIKVASGKHAHHAYRLQVNAQLGALGLRKGYIYTVFGTHADTEEVTFDPELYQQQKAAAEAFLQAVRDNTPPVPAEMLEARDEGLPELDLSEREGEGEAVVLMADIAELERQVAPLSERLSELRDKLKLAMMTTNLRTVKTGFAIAELREVQSERLDTKALKQAHPDIAAQFVKNTSYTQLKIKLL